MIAPARTRMKRPPGAAFFMEMREKSGTCRRRGAGRRCVGIRRNVLRHNEMMIVRDLPALRIPRAGATGAALAAVLAFAQPAARAAEGSVYYICPGNVFTNTLTPKEAEAKGCQTKEAQQPTTIPAPRMPRPVASPGGPASRVGADEQRERDTDSRRILQDELAKAESTLAALQKLYNNGQPERQGDEKNYQKYIDRTAELKASVARSQADVDALRREIAKLPAQ